jgi:hypothetical protein
MRKTTPCPFEHWATLQNLSDAVALQHLTFRLAPSIYHKRRTVQVVQGLSDSRLQLD